MAILTTWDNSSKNTVHVEFESEWSWDDLEAAIDKTDRLIASVPHHVDIIIDVEGSSIPKDFMNAAKNLLANPEPRDNEGRRIVVGAGKMMRTAYSAVQKTFGEKLVGRELLFADDLTQARAILYSLRLEERGQ